MDEMQSAANAAARSYSLFIQRLEEKLELKFDLSPVQVHQIIISMLNQAFLCQLCEEFGVPVTERIRINTEFVKWYNVQIKDFGEIEVKD